MEKLLLYAMICAVCFNFSGCAATTGSNLSPIGFTQQQKVDDFNYLQELMNELYPFLGEATALGAEQDVLYAKYLALIEASNSDCAFLNLISAYLDEVNLGSLGHLACIGPADYSYMVDLYETVEGRTAWETLLKNSVTASMYVQFGSNRRGKFIPASQEDQRRVTAASPKERSAPLDADIFHAEIINNGKTGYIRIPSFDNSLIADQVPRVKASIAEMTSLPNLILDIRGNSGGSDFYWMDAIVSPNIYENQSYSMYYLFKETLFSNTLVKPFLDEIHPQLKLQSQPIDDLPEFKDLSKRASDFQYFTVSTNTVLANPSASPYLGRIWVLTDSYNASASESFINFCDETDFATQVGQQSGGDNCNGDPTLFSLPNSGLVIRFDLFYGLNPDGTANSVSGTRPDVVCDPKDALDFCLEQINA